MHINTRRKLRAIEQAQAGARETGDNWTVNTGGSTGYYYHCQRAADDDHEWSDYFCTITPDDADTDPFEILNNLSKHRKE